MTSQHINPNHIYDLWVTFTSHIYHCWLFVFFLFLPSFTSCLLTLFSFFLLNPLTLLSLISFFLHFHLPHLLLFSFLSSFSSLLFSFNLHPFRWYFSIFFPSVSFFLVFKLNLNCKKEETFYDLNMFIQQVSMTTVHQCVCVCFILMKWSLHNILKCYSNECEPINDVHCTHTRPVCVCLSVCVCLFYLMRQNCCICFFLQIWS